MLPLRLLFQLQVGWETDCKMFEFPVARFPACRGRLPDTSKDLTRKQQCRSTGLSMPWQAPGSTLTLNARVTWLRDVIGVTSCNS